MTYSLTWLPQVLREAGLKVALVPGWETRGSGDVGTVQGIICHHTAGPRVGNMPSLRIVTNGRPDLPGPLSQLGLGRDGTYYVIAAGRCTHAGRGDWNGIKAGNTNFIGIEAENTGLSNDFPWPQVQLDAYQRGVAAILKRIGKSAEFCCGHREYALPSGRKSDPTFDMESFRSVVTSILDGTATPPTLIPAAEPAAQPNGQPGRPTLRRGAKGEFVKQLQRKLKLAADGDFGPGTEAAARTFQREHGMVPDGIIGPKSWAKLDALASA
jgi:hypothetical protein